MFELGIVLVAVLVIWWLGFFNSGKKLANVANRAATKLELEQGQKLQAKYGKDEITKTKDYLAEFDSL